MHFCRRIEILSSHRRRRRCRRRRRRLLRDGLQNTRMGSASHGRPGNIKKFSFAKRPKIS